MAASAGSGQDQGADKNSYYILWLVALIVFICAIIWHFFDQELKKFFIVVRIGELQAIYTFLKLFPAELPWFGETISKWIGEISADLEIVKTITPATINLDIADTLSVTVGEYLRYPFSIYLIILSLIIVKMNVQMRLRKKYSIRTLAQQEIVNWPQIKIATKLNLLDQDLDEGPWAMAMSPIQFAKKNKLISVELADVSQSPFSKVQVPEYKVTLDRIRTERAFSVQLGRMWQGFMQMAPHRRAILAVFAARGCRDSKTALALVSQLASSAAESKLDCTGADELWNKHAKTRRIQEICGYHAYEFTLFISMLQYAREDGVVASADFLWVKPIDRRLWYVINNVGRQTPCVEVGGIFSHWYYEMALKRPLSAPKVDNAVDALELALSEIVYIPDDKEKDEILKRHESKQESKENSEQSTT